MRELRRLTNLAREELAALRPVRIGIIGAGRIGGMLAQLYAEAGHEIAIANSRGPETLRELAGRLGARVHPAEVDQAVCFGPVVIVAIPFGRYRELPAAAFSGRTVIDTMNYDPGRDGHFAELDQGRRTSSELLQDWLPGAAVVRTFNTMHWSHLREHGRQSSAQHRYAIPVCGVDPAAKRTVFDLIERLGFEPVDAGGLAAGGRRQHPGASAHPADTGSSG